MSAASTGDVITPTSSDNIVTSLWVPFHREFDLRFTDFIAGPAHRHQLVLVTLAELIVQSRFESDALRTLFV
eukprot:COSAG02_NODE_4920_length_4836_cov_2.883682_3_plen_72_part_00